SGLGFDIEVAVRTANDTISGTFNGVSKGMRDFPRILQSTTSNVLFGKSLTYFGFLLGVGVFFVFIAFTMFLPVMVLMPQKFAILLDPSLHLKVQRIISNTCYPKRYFIMILLALSILIGFYMLMTSSTSNKGFKVSM
ncbi:hypothetical protein GIB67_018537, partial [Kingdonia uniflora]